MMPHKSLYLILLFLAIGFKIPAQVKKVTGNTSLLPLKMGNYWVYTSSQSPEKRDTVEITRNKVVGMDTAYYFNNTLMMVKNDTVFEFQPQRNGTGLPSVQYFPSETDANYPILVGGDAWAGRSVKKIKQPYKVKGKEYNNCYEFRDVIYNKSTVFSKGIGIIEMRYPDQTISLVEYKIN